MNSTVILADDELDELIDAVMDRYVGASAALQARKRHLRQVESWAGETDLRKIPRGLRVDEASVARERAAVEQSAARVEWLGELQRKLEAV